MLEEIDYVASQLPGREFDSFAADLTLKREFVRSLEIIGEAAKKYRIASKRPIPRSSGAKSRVYVIV